MVSTKELREGNIVRHIGSGKNVEIKAADWIIRLHHGDGIINYQFTETDIDPIPLTPEIMEKAGFERKNYVAKEGHMDSMWEYDTVEFSEDYELSDETSGAAYRLGQPLKYLHQLQNLYFFLMGTEIEINF